MGAAVARVCCEARAVELLRNTKRECERGFDGVQRNVPTIVHDRTVVVLLSRSEEQRCHLESSLMGLFCFWLKCRTFSSRWRRKAEEEKRKKEAEEQHKAAQMPSYEEQMVWAAIVVRTSPTRR